VNVKLDDLGTKRPEERGRGGLLELLKETMGKAVGAASTRRTRGQRSNSHLRRSKRNFNLEDKENERVSEATASARPRKERKGSEGPIKGDHGKVGLEKKSL